MMKRVVCNSLSWAINSTRRLMATKTKGQYLQSVYREMVKDSGIREDQHQLMALQALDRLYVDLLKLPERLPDELTQQPKASSFWNIFSSHAKQVLPASWTMTKGVYLHGGVGCGKTFCMNLFYSNLDTDDKQQVHFHKFMLGVHQQMHEAKMVEGIKGDVLPRVVERTLQRGRIICFDEFQVTDVADALILQRLFTSLMQQGAIIVATSNRAPQDLYLGGLQRDRFLPFIDLLHERLQVVSMWDSEVDYRLVQSDVKAKGVYFVGKERRNDFDAVFHALTKDSSVVSTSLQTQGRLVPIPRAAVSKGVARFSFEDLCTKALGAADYLVIGQNFHTVFVEGVPKLNRNEINWVRRFIIFVDAMYESHVKLILQAQTQPEGIFQVDLEDDSCDEVFAFDRTRSRLEEMRSESYLRRRWIGGTVQKDAAKAKLRVEPSLSQNIVPH